jgi:hypothetical protein
MTDHHTLLDQMVAQGQHVAHSDQINQLRAENEQLRVERIELIVHRSVYKRYIEACPT